MEDDVGVLERERRRRGLGGQLLADLGVLEAWSTIGRPEVEGAMALGLVVDRDIDIEVLVDDLDLRRVVEVWLQLRRHPAVVRGSVIERPEPPFGGTYCLLVARDSDGDEWSIETWVFPRSRTGRRGVDIVAALRPRLDDRTRGVVLRLKEAVRARSDVARVQSLRIYEAVLDHGIVELDDLLRWMARNPPPP